MTTGSASAGRARMARRLAGLLSAGLAIGGAASVGTAQGPVGRAALVEARAAAAYALVDLRTGAVLAEQHPAILATHVRAGSIAKVATMTAAIEAGLLTPGTRIACTRDLRLADGRRVPCAHPAPSAPFDPGGALAESCNVFFATLAKQIPRASLSAALVRLGLDPLAAADDAVAAAIGLGRGRAEPRRLVGGVASALAQPLVAEGLARAADRGTASALGQAGMAAYAKTGTANMRGGRPLGIAVALVPRPAPTRGVVVLLPGGSGADAARIAAEILAPGTEREPAGTIRIGEPIAGGRHDVRAVPLEDYVARVVAGETPADTPPAARQALGIAARTFALANRGRHRDDGFDLCTLTHCQVTRPPDPGAHAAARATAGRILTASAAGRAAVPAPVFYSASCGGTLAAIAAIAPGLATAAQPWHRSRPDPAGVDEPAWSQHLDVLAVERALRDAGWKGSALRGLSIDADGRGRVRRVRLDGLEPAAVPFDDFRRVIGQRLGWQLVKSARFTVERTGRGYTLRGRGLGHGVGLCVFGASALARQGWSADRLLAAYFEGLRVAPGEPPLPVSLHVPAESHADEPSLRRLVLDSVRGLSRTLEAPLPASLTIVMHPTVESYSRATGQPWWTTAATRVQAGAARIDTLPPAVLRRQGQLETTLRHELVHVLTDERLRGAPLWQREGLAIAHSGARLLPLAGPCPTDAEIERARDRASLAHAYRRALHCVNLEAAAGGR